MNIFEKLLAKLNAETLPTPKKDDEIANIILDGINGDTPIEMLDNKNIYNYYIIINGIEILIAKTPTFFGGEDHGYALKIKKVLDINDHIVKAIYDKVEKIFRDRLIETLKN